VEEAEALVVDMAEKLVIVVHKQVELAEVALMQMEVLVLI
jgi:hypothetical protein